MSIIKCVRMFLHDFIRKQYLGLVSSRRKKYLANLVSKGLKLGNNVQIVDTFFFDPSHCFLISIGDNCTICPNVRLIAHDASTKKILGYTKIGRIVLNKNCFIGDSVIILPNVTVGENSIVGAGSVVTKDIPPETIAAGNPARTIATIKDYKEKMQLLSKGKKIFSEEYYIEKLDNMKRQEIIASIGDSVGFIV